MTDDMALFNGDIIDDADDDSSSGISADLPKKYSGSSSTIKIPTDHKGKVK
jgi:hypothetical protein